MGYNFYLQYSIISAVACWTVILELIEDFDLIELMILHQNIDVPSHNQLIKTTIVDYIKNYAEYNVYRLFI